MPPQQHSAPPVTLVPQSGLQFVSRVFDLPDDGPGRMTFQEEPTGDPAPDGKRAVRLRRLAPREAAALRDSTGRLPQGTYGVAFDEVLAALADEWLPLPYLRVPAEEAAGTQPYEKGPTNWARLRLAREAAGDGGPDRWRALLAFDTGFVAAAGGGFFGLTPKPGEQDFELCGDADLAAWFVGQPWVAMWLDAVFMERLALDLGRKPGPQDRRHAHLHLARYLTLLEVLRRSGAMPRVKLVDIVSDRLPYTPIDVDLVLDIGNSRTCGVLVETNHDAGEIDLNQSYPLRLRDLGMPERMCEEPFESRVEFARASFGRDTISRRSGRAAAFIWPSPVRVGPEAIRLSAGGRGNSGPTGLSSPKRYLWDSQPAQHVWRWNDASPGSPAEPAVNGGFMQFLREDGEVLRMLSADAVGAVQARFSRGSLFMLMLAELVLQAIAQINAPEVRAAHKNAAVPRRLRRVILTLPTAMPLAEQRLLRRCAEGAVKLVWDLQGWSRAEAHLPHEPEVVAQLDEASATQLVFLYTEVAKRLSGNLGWFMSLYGRERRGGQRSVRVASIDIGGGTTDLMVATYTVGRGDGLCPEQNFREGFKIAGDDLLRQAIEAIVLPQLGAALAAAGLRDAADFLKDMFAGDRAGQEMADGYMRRQVVARLLEPAALAILGADERRAEDELGEILRQPLRDLLGAGAPAERAIAYFDAAARARGAASDFSIAAVEVIATADAVAEAVRVALGNMLADLCEAVHAMRCDFLLLSGRPSRLRAVRDIVLARLPVALRRIVHMHRYETGDWYPFRDSSRRIADPKTTAVVGAVLATLAEGQLPGFFLESSRLSMRSTARFLGPLDTTGQLLNGNVLIDQQDLNSRQGHREVLRDLTFQMQLFLGFRQMPLQRWPATPLYRLSWTNPSDAPAYRKPLTVRLRRAEIDKDDREREARREDFEVEEAQDRDREPLDPKVVTLRLQTMMQETYWRDTGTLNAGPPA